jgi:uncharacterized protein YciI
MIFLFTINTAYSQSTTINNQKKTFIYVLKLTEKYHDEKNWQAQESKIIGDHFERFVNMMKEGILVFAGRTEVELSNTFGIAVYYAGSFEEAKKIAEDDPAVKAGIMIAEVFPFSLALLKGVKEK